MTRRKDQEPAIVRMGINVPDQESHGPKGVDGRPLNIRRPRPPVSVAEVPTGRQRYVHRIGTPAEYGSSVKAVSPKTAIQRLIEGPTPGTGSQEVDTQVGEVKETVVYSKKAEARTREEARRRARDVKPPPTKPQKPAVPQHQRGLWEASILNPNRK